MSNSRSNMTDTTWSTTIEDAGDGSGDGILTFPPELCEMKGWKEGTVLNLEVSDGMLIITEVNAEKQQSLDK
jgi:hypothetical protein